MTPPRFAFDSNILIYTSDTSEGDRHHVAIDLVRRSASAPAAITLQSLFEFANVLIRKAKADPDEVRLYWREFASALPVVVPDLEAGLKALALIERHNLSFFDALMLATVAQTGCRYLLSEDLADGEIYDGVNVVNPFKAANLSLLETIFAP